MVYLEDKLVHFINTEAQEDAQKVFKEIVKAIKDQDLDQQAEIRYMKNYLISLNSLLYINCRKRLVCLQKLIDLRDSIMNQIEEQSTVEDIIRMGEEMINQYLTFINNQLCQINNPIINDALAYIKNNLDKELSLEEVANAIHVSKSHLSNLFSKCIGNSFSHHVNKLKIEKAKELLAKTRLSIMDITVECGFNSQSYFSRVFSGFEGMTPIQYRKLYGETRLPADEAL
ncbi:MAG TPA: helix-turn-helix transcriptional regulator [Thermoanaerobacterales bacterium]|uniref:AraC family transcriptional regulator n=1 Tax=Tepidanaerobacter sp. GT38 TaxID=2722793 RepID=UPI0017A28390|nr:AraC family transcriptional regulator [Tepidanaerobacter sp. GT38]MCG1011302.1 helix-turn-helix transcriptional regulator [Tepidanaerobacter sp. GT38]HHY42872.1 helix-turn-helix transcriptional regulator [Thermoanaerobacterales bacterium]